MNSEFMSMRDEQLVELYDGLQAEIDDGETNPLVHEYLGSVESEIYDRGVSFEESRQTLRKWAASDYWAARITPFPGGECEKMLHIPYYEPATLIWGALPVEMYDDGSAGYEQIMYR